MSTNTDAGLERDFRRIVKWSTSLGFGLMVASLEALGPSTAGFSFAITARTGLALVIASAIPFLFWRCVFSDAGLRPHTGRLLFFSAAFVGLGGFLYPLRFVPRDKWPDIFRGLGTAMVALSILAGMMWSMKRFFDSDDPSGNH